MGIAYRTVVRDWGLMDERPNPDEQSSYTSTRAYLSEEVRDFMNECPPGRRDTTGSVLPAAHRGIARSAGVMETPKYRGYRRSGCPGNRMKAVGLEAFGDPDVLQVLDVPEPDPTPGRAVVTVVAATVNPTDLMFRSGKQAASMTQLSPPYIPGMEFAGHVHALGDGSTGVKIGQPVMGIINPRRPEGGAQSERLSVLLNSLVPLAASADLAEAATIPMNGLTALKARQSPGPRAGPGRAGDRRCGGLGGYVIQLAKRAGFKVITYAKDADRDLLERLGAARSSLGARAWQKRCGNSSPTGGGLVDAAVIGGTAGSLVRDGGMCVSVRRLQGADDTRVRHHAVAVAQHAEDADALKELGRLMTEGVLTPGSRGGFRSSRPQKHTASWGSAGSGAASC
jgi:NADPH2:quinone reductase